MIAVFRRQLEDGRGCGDSCPARAYAISCAGLTWRLRISQETSPETGLFNLKAEESSTSGLTTLMGCPRAKVELTRFGGHTVPCVREPRMPEV